MNNEPLEAGRTDAVRAATALFGFIPLAIICLCAVGIWYALTAPSEPLHVADTALKAAMEKIIPQVTQAMFQYSRVRYAIHFLWIALDTLFLWAFLQFGLASHLRDFARNKSCFLIVQLAIFIFVFSATMALTLSPVSYVTGFWIKHHFGLSNQPLNEWLTDFAKAFFINFAVELPLWWLIYKAVTKYKRQWPYLVFFGSVPVILALTFVAPLIIDPVFNKIEPMAASPLKLNIAKLAKAAGIENAPIFTCDRHKQTNEINAYVTGLGSSARIVLWDTTLQKLPADQVLCVVAHELGHYVLKHVYWGCGIAVLISLVIVPVNVWLTPRVFTCMPRSWNISTLQDFAGIPFLMLCVTITGFCSEPLINGYSRGVEHQADMFGFRLAGSGAAFARTFASLSRENLAEPSPPRYIGLWLFSHPPLADRIESVLQP